jgi:hypothetical protein
MPLVGADITPNFAPTLNVEWVPWCIIITIIITLFLTLFEDFWCFLILKIFKN